MDNYREFIEEIFNTLKTGKITPIYRVYYKNIEILVLLYDLQAHYYKCEISITNPVSENIDQKCPLKNLLNTKVQKIIPFSEFLTNESNIEYVVDHIINYIRGLRTNESIIFIDKNNLNFTDINTYNRLIKSEKFFDKYEEKCWICLDRVSQYETTSICKHPIHYLCLIDFLTNMTRQTSMPTPMHIDCGICKTHILTKTESGTWI